MTPLDERLDAARSEYLDRSWPIPDPTDHRRPPAPNRRRSVLAAAAIGVCVVLLAVIATRRGPTDGDVVAGPSTSDTTAPAQADTAGIAAGLMTADVSPEAPVVPPGWKLIDYADFRFAVPTDWQIAISRSCWQPHGDPPPSGVLFLRSSPTTDDATCSPQQPLPDSVLTLEGGHPASSDSPGESTTVGTLSALRLPSCAVSNCPQNQYWFDGGFILAVASPLENQVLSTFTASGRNQALHSGPVASRADWESVTVAGVTVQVPPTWHVIDLPASYYEQRGPDGAVMSGGQLNPGECSGIYFSSDPGTAPTAYLGSSPIVPSCPFTYLRDLSPADGIWIRTVNDQREPASDVERSVEVGNVTVALLNHSDRLTVPVIDLRIETPTGTTLVSIGVGPDPSIARAILESVRLA